MPLARTDSGTAVKIVLAGNAEVKHVVGKTRGKPPGGVALGDNAGPFLRDRGYINPRGDCYLAGNVECGFVGDFDVIALAA